MRYSLGIGLLACLSTVSAVAAADRGETISTPAAKDKATQTPGEASAAEEKPSPWTGSIVLFDQSATTQTLGIGKDYQSSNPTYELWFAFKPRYTFYKTDTTTISAGAWANLYLELTNSDTTTTEREPLLGPTILSGSISEQILKRGEYTTTVSVGPRLTLPTDKESFNAGRYFSLGAGGGISQSVPLNGKDASAFNGLKFELSSIYSHPLNHYTTPTNPNINQGRQDVDGRLVVDNQLRFGMNVQHSLSLRFGADAQLTPKLNFGVAYVLGNTWTYRPTPATLTSTSTGPAVPQPVDNPTNYRVETWAVASLDYDLLDEMSVGVGYYNKTNQLGPDGERRSPLWSPEARFFLTLTGNLDPIFQHFKSKPPPQTASSKPQTPSSK